MASINTSVNSQCLFCLQDLKVQPEVRELKCGHRACSSCLTDRVKVTNSNIKCPECSEMSENVNLDDLEVVSTYKTPLCGSLKCEDNAEVFCRTCSQFFCTKHHQVHNEIIHDHTVEDIEMYRNQERGLITDDRWCDIHQESEIIISCKHCLLPLCSECLQSGTDGRKCTNQSGHTAPMSLKDGVSLVKEKLAVEMAQLQEADLKMEYAVKLANLYLSDLRSANEAKKSEIATTVVRQKAKLDETAEKFISQIDESTEKFERETAVYEQKMNDSLTRSRSIQDSTTEFSSFTNQAALKRFHERNTVPKQKIEPPALPMSETFIPIENDVKCAMSLRKLKAPYYESIHLNESTNKGIEIKTVYQLPDKKLLHGGPNGLADITDTEMGVINSIKINSKKDTIYCLCRKDNQFVLSRIRMEQGVAHSEPFLQYARAAGKQLKRFSNNDNYIIITDINSGGLKVFSNADYKWLFDMKIEALKYPIDVICFTNNTVVVADFEAGLLINLTIEKEPLTLWSLAIASPSSIHFDQNTTCMLVLSWSQNQIYVVSTDGILIKTLKTFGNDCIYDVSVSGNGLVLATKDGLKQYKIKYFEQS